jgi:flagellar protein FlaG
MDSTSINPTKGPDIQTPKAPTPVAKPVQKPPKAEVKAAPKDTVSLSPAAKDALESRASSPEVAEVAKEAPKPSSENSARPADIPDSGSADSGVDSNSRKFSVTEAKDVVVTIIDNKTQEVVKQIPTEEVIDLRNAIRDGVEKIAPKDNPTEKLI